MPDEQMTTAEERAVLQQFAIEVPKMAAFFKEAEVKFKELGTVPIELKERW